MQEDKKNIAKDIDTTDTDNMVASNVDSDNNESTLDEAQNIDNESNATGVHESTKDNTGEPSSLEGSEELDYINNEELDYEESDEEKDHTLRNIVITIIIIIIILLLLRSCGKGTGNAPIDTSEPTTVAEESLSFNEGKSIEETEEQAHVEAATVNYVLNSTVVVSDGQISGMGIENNNENRYIRAVYKLDDSTVYDSQLINIGDTLDSDVIAEDAVLPASGEYDTIVEMYSYDLEQNLRGQTNFEITIIIE